MMNPKRRRKARKARRRSASHRAPTHKALFRKRKRASNPKRHRRHTALRAPTHKHHHRRRRSSNPAFLGNFTGMLGEAAFLVGGGIGTRSLPTLVTGLLGNPGMNSGIVGYLMNLVSATVLSWAVGKWKGPSAARSVMLGGVVFTGARVFEDYFGEKLVSFAQVSPNAPYISGDARYGMALAGAFSSQSFILPTSTPSVGRRQISAASPAGAAPAKAAAPALHAGF